MPGAGEAKTNDPSDVVADPAAALAASLETDGGSPGLSPVDQRRVDTTMLRDSTEFSDIPPAVTFLSVFWGRVDGLGRSVRGLDQSVVAN